MFIKRIFRDFSSFLSFIDRETTSVIEKNYEHDLSLSLSPPPLFSVSQSNELLSYKRTKEGEEEKKERKRIEKRRRFDAVSRELSCLSAY
jgi:hypothetical protein